MELGRITVIANKYLALIEPLCRRSMIVGSIRRCKSDCKDIEIICIRDTAKLFDFNNVVRSWQNIKGEPLGKYTQRILPEGVKLDLFMVNEENWWPQVVIRTGPAQFSKDFMGAAIKVQGYQMQGGYLWKDGKKVAPQSEREVFELAGYKYIEPEDRR